MTTRTTVRYEGAGKSSAPGLRVSSPSDGFERQADAVASRILAMPEPGGSAFELQRPPDVVARCAGGCNCTEEIHRQAEEEIHRQVEEEEEEEIQLTPDGAAVGGSVTATDVRGIGNGAPLPTATRRFFEPRFGADLSQVRIHTGERAGNLTRQVGAKAFTYHQDIAFAPGQYQPDSTAGRQLLAHELTHTIQQKHGASSVMRMLACPSTLRESDPVPRGFKAYFGNPNWFHCGYRGILEDRTPTTSDPQNECFYDETGALVDQHHPHAGCRGTPNYYDSSSSPISHTFRDPGGIWHAGGEAFVASRIHDLVGAIDAAVTTLRTAAEVAAAPFRAFGDLIAFSLLRAGAVVDPLNWEYHGLPSRSRRHLNVMGLLLGSTTLVQDADEFLGNVTRRLDAVLNAEFRAELAADINTALEAQGSTTRVTAAQIGESSLVELIEWLNGAGIIVYKRSPEDIANEAMGYDEEEGE